MKKYKISSIYSKTDDLIKENINPDVLAKLFYGGVKRRLPEHTSIILAIDINDTSIIV